ncbi:MAG: chorismate synthase [Bacteroidia bacterium]|nr:chorismate synthase [Bacteroidia bacterium]
MNTFGRLFRVTSFGESHGPAVGCVVDGCPAGVRLDLDLLQRELDRRRPGQSRLTTQRSEADTAEVLSGLYQGLTTGAPIALVARNEDARSRDYETFAEAYRPSHADYTYQAKYGIRDHRGGGRSSARATWAMVAAGAIAQQLLREAAGVDIRAWVASVGPHSLPEADPSTYAAITLDQVEATPVRCPDPAAAEVFTRAIEAARKAGDTLGGTVACRAVGVPPGWGEPLYAKLHAELGAAVLGLNACHGFEYGSGFAGTALTGSAHNDAFVTTEGRVGTATNRSGGIQGGISNGELIYFRAAFKPVATILAPQATVTTAGEPTTLTGRGRHDPCVVPRAVPIVEAVTALVLADAWLQHRARQR